jgi:hypothetical protein
MGFSVFFLKSSRFVTEFLGSQGHEGEHHTMWISSEESLLNLQGNMFPILSVGKFRKQSADSTSTTVGSVVTEYGHIPGGSRPPLSPALS